MHKNYYRIATIHSLSLVILDENILAKHKLFIQRKIINQ
jgi:hypothetical protein